MAGYGQAEKRAIFIDYKGGLHVQEGLSDSGHGQVRGAVMGGVSKLHDWYAASVVK